jgi:hypothetical protein
MGTSRTWLSLCRAVLLGCVATLIPLAGKPLLNSNSVVLNALGYVLALFALPGFWIALLAGQGVHDLNLWLVGWTNGLLYTGAAYWVLKGRSSARARDRDNSRLAQKRAQVERDRNVDQGG